MTEAARLTLIADSTSLGQGEKALDNLARTGGRVESKMKGDLASIEKAMAKLGATMGNLDRTMTQVGQAVAGAMGRTAQEAQRGARSFDDLRRSIDPAYAASQRFSDVQRELAGMVASGAAAQDQANQVLEVARSRYLGIATAAEQAEQAQRDQAQAVALATGSYQSLRAALDPVYASSQRYEQALETANAALQAKIITEKEHARVMQLAESRYLALAPAVAGATGGLARFTPQLQAAGFQVQDFAVQVASGQSAMVAFTQQFPQLAGALGVSGKLALLGVGLGTLVAVGAAVAPMFMGMGSSAKTAEEAVDALEEAVGNYQAAVSGATMSTDELSAKFGVNAGAARELYAVMKDLADLEFAQAMANAVSAATGVFSGLSAELDRVNQLSQASIGDTTKLSAAFGRLQGAVGDLSEKYGLGYGQLVDLNRAMADLENAKGPAEQARAAAVLVGSLRDAQAAGADIPPVILQTANELARASMLGLELTGNSDNSAVALRNAEAAARGLASALAAAAGFSAGIENQIQVIESRIAAQKAGADAAIAGQLTSMRLEAAAARDRQIAAGVDQYNAEALYQLDMDRIAQLGERTAQERALAEASREAATAGKKGASEAEKASKKAATEAKRQAEALDKEAEKWGELLNPVRKYQNAMRDLAALKGRLSDEEMAQAQRQLNVELADSIPMAGEFVDIMTTGMLNKFDGTLKSMWNMLKQWLANAMAMAAKNSIAMSMGVGGGAPGAVASAAGGVPGVGGAGGVLGGLMGGAGTIAGAALSGAGGFMSALGGGLGSAATYTSFMLKGATTSLAGFGSALGAIALPLAAVVGVFSFFKKKTKELDAGIRVTVDGMSTLVEEFRKTETRRFWGLSKKVRTSYDEADQETHDALSRVVGSLQKGVTDAAKVLGFGAETFAGFAHVMQVSTKGMSEEDALKAVQDAIAGLGDDFAGMVPGLARFTKEGETASQALTRLSQSLVGVNGIMDTLGHKFRAAGLQGAALASDIAALFGGLEAMATATQRYYEAFYSEAERLATTTRQTRAALADLGIAMPKTRAEYRAIIEALDLTTEKGRKTYAALIGMAGAMDQVLPKAASLTREMEKLVGAVSTGLDSAISATQTAAKANADAAASWYKASASIREYIDKLRGTASALFSPQQALRYNRGQYQATRTRALAGDLSAAQEITGSADRYLASVLATAKTREQAALAQARVLSDLRLLQGVGDIEGARHDVIAGLLGQQVKVMEQYRDILVANGSLTAKQIGDLTKKLGGLDEAIAAAELINYQYLKERLAVTVDVIADADIPAHLKTLLSNATNGVEGFVDFIVRSDLSPDLKWLALAKSSEHLKTIGFLTDNQMSAEYTRLALKAGSQYQVRVTSAIEAGSVLNLEQLRQLFTGSTSGKIILGGSFRFDPAAGFATWYETASKTAIKTPMDALRGAMGNLRGSLAALRAAIVAEEKRRADAIDAATGAVNTPRPAPAPAPATPAPPKAYTLGDYRLRTFETGGSNSMSTRTSVTGPLGGSRSFTDPFGNSLAVARRWLAKNNYPAFALGGTHRGGPAHIAEDAPELVAPSRIYNPAKTRAMLDNREVVAELRQVVRRLDAVETFTRKTAESTTEAKKDLREMNVVGVKIDPDQNAVSGMSGGTSTDQGVNTNYVEIYQGAQ